MEVEGYPDYLIYPDGKVWSKNVKRYLKQGHNNHGYLQVDLCKDGKRKTLTIHRLVALHYIPNPDNKNEIDHINRDRKDNRVENLRWATHSENNQNTLVQKNNKLGIKNIRYKKSRYAYEKMINGERHTKYFKTLTDALCYKFIFILKIIIRDKVGEKTEK